MYDKDKARQLDGHNNFFCHRKNRICGGVSILARESLNVTHLTSHTRKHSQLFGYYFMTTNIL